MSDPQKDAVYAWETTWRGWNEHNVPRRTLRRLIRAAERKYRIPPVHIRFTNRVRRAKRFAKIASEYDPNEHSIVLGFRDHNYAIALHEVAHAITDYLFGFDLEPHGRHWLGIYMWLLEWARVAPGAALRASAKAAGLRWIGPDMIGPRFVRGKFARLIERGADD